MRNIATYRINCAFDTEIDTALAACKTPEEALLGLVYRLHCKTTAYERWWLLQFKSLYEARVAERMVSALRLQ